MQGIEVTHLGYLITTDKHKMYPAQVHEWLATKSYWAKGIPYATFATSFEHSFCVGALLGTEQVAFARLVTDYATFAYLADVFVMEAYRGKGISKVMMQELFQLDWVLRLRRLMLATMDAHGVYTRVGFQPLAYPERIMEVARAGLYEISS
jgi:GNAT superfamily N-acetyltransferase